MNLHNIQFGGSKFENDFSSSSSTKRHMESYDPEIFIKGPCMPGQLICFNKQCKAGEGTYELGDSIYASILGLVHTEKIPGEEFLIVSVRRNDVKPPFTVPTLGSVVTCVITARNLGACRCLITHVGNQRLDDVFNAVIRRNSIYGRSRDFTKIETSFGLGDTVIARIVGIVDGDFILSTADEELGVATSVGSEGHCMIPGSWTRMVCAKTGESVERKVAKIVLEKQKQ